MKYRRMPIEIESPEEMGYGNLRCNLTESSVRDLALADLELDLQALVLAYTDHRGKPSMRERIATSCAGTDAEDVLITAGAAAALFIVSTSLLEAGSHLVVVRPNYATNIETPRAIGCRVDHLDLTFEQGFRYDLERLAGLIRPETRLISITTPHNPTGVVLAEEELHAILAMAEKNDCHLLVDETYGEMNYGSKQGLAAGLSPRCISVASLSKSYGLPGIRMGWVITRDPKLQETLLAAKEQIGICNSIVDEAIADQVLARKEEILPPILERNRRALAEVKAWMEAQAEMEWVEPGGGVVCFPRIRPGSAVDVDRFYNILNRKYSTFVGPGHWFEMDRRYMRVGYGWPKPEELTEGLENMSRALHEAGQG